MSLFWVRIVGAPNEANFGNSQVVLDKVAQILSFLFSWIILLSIGVIVSGKFLAKVFPMTGVKETHFKIPLIIFRIEARNEEVVLGMSAFLITLLFVAPIGGANLYSFLISHLGIDPGQFNMLCIASATITVAWTSSLWLITEKRKPASGQKKVRALLDKIERKTKDREDELNHV